MSFSASTVDVQTSTTTGNDPERDEVMALVIAWSATEPHRIGEVAFFPDGGRPLTLGRGGGLAGSARVDFLRQRPGICKPTPPLEGPRISREQLRIQAYGGALHIERVGRCPVHLAGVDVDQGVLHPGGTLLIKGQLLLYCTRRSRALPPLRTFPASSLGDFGEPDRFGILGESPVAHRLRDEIAWNARVGTHLLVLGESGVGKELTVRALHALAPRAHKPFVARNAATIPAGLADAELFGNMKNYPNPGMPERPGLIGEAHGGTLFLDEIGELPESLQAHLLRVLDGEGEYHRLGEAVPRRADVRLVAATNRKPGALKHDLLARLPLRLVLPSLNERREDIPLLARHLLCRASVRNPELVQRFLAPATTGIGEPRFEPELIERLLRHRFVTNVRELESLLWRAMARSPDDTVAWPRDDTDSGTEPPASTSDSGAHAGAEPSLLELPETPSSDVAGCHTVEPSPSEIHAAFEQHRGNVSRAARTLGLPSRYALYRLMRKYGIEIERMRTIRH